MKQPDRYSIREVIADSAKLDGTPLVNTKEFIVTTSEDYPGAVAFATENALIFVQQEDLLKFIKTKV